LRDYEGARAVEFLLLLIILNRVKVIYHRKVEGVRLVKGLRKYGGVTNAQFRP